jgi:hypothetical protein
VARWALWLLAGWLASVALAGCTVQRIEADTAAALEWLRFKSGTEVRGTTRWQLPRDARIQVVEAGPADDPSWLAAAQAGVDRVFPLTSYADPDYRLLVAWPPAGRPRGPEVSFWEIVDMDQFLPDFQGPFQLRVALLRTADGALVEAAALEVRPHWFTSEAKGPMLVQRAFEAFADDFRSAL